MFFLFGSDELMSLASLTNPHQSSLSVDDKGIRSAATQIDGSIRFSVYPSHSRDENPSISVSVRVYSWRGLAIYRPLGLKSLHARDLDIRRHLCVRHRDDDLRGIVARYLLVYTRVSISGSMRVSLRSFSQRMNKDALLRYIPLFCFNVIRGSEKAKKREGERMMEIEWPQSAFFHEIKLKHLPSARKTFTINQFLDLLT